MNTLSLIKSLNDELKVAKQLNEFVQPDFKENQKVKIEKGAYAGEIGNVVSYQKYKKKIDNIAFLAGTKFDPARDIAIIDPKLGKIRYADKNFVKPVMF